MSHNHIATARRVLDVEARAVAALGERVSDTFEQACELLLACKGRVIVTGMGKSGHIGSKLAATLASTGTPSFFVHPGEASHGDLGMITTEDAVLALSNSGETGEILTIIPVIKRKGAVLISMTGRPSSSLAQLSDVHLDVGVEEEACPHNLAPTTSTTAALAMGDALAIALLEARGFGETAACVVFVEASAFSSRAIEANASGRSSCSRSSRLSGLRLCSVWEL